MKLTAQYYVIEKEDMEKLLTLKTRLYAEHKWKIDEMSDTAKRLDSILESAVPFFEGDCI